ncbi:MAG: protease modulator HflK [Planctomycetales bacterium]|nr:protease modulator HflK [Planctomycetales bacterium]
MKRWLLSIVMLAYFASGLFIVRGNEQVLVRRFGKARLPLVASGLRFDLPWPFVRLDRVNLNEVRTVSLGIQVAGNADPRGFLREVARDRQGEFLTGDKNILNVQVAVQYRIANPMDYLFMSESPERALRLLTESLVTDVAARSGVDFIHPLGLNELRELLTASVSRVADEHRLGLLIEDVSIVSVLPPVEVKSAFLDVSNARAEKDRMIQEEFTRGEQLVAAETDSHRRIEISRGESDRFEKTIAQFQVVGETPATPSAELRRMTMQRLFVSTLGEILPRLAGKVFLDSAKPVDLTIWPRPAESNRTESKDGTP